MRYKGHNAINSQFLLKERRCLKETTAFNSWTSSSCYVDGWCHTAGVELAIIGIYFRIRFVLMFVASLE
jgi:hypothetical protein